MTVGGDSRMNLLYIILYCIECLFYLSEKIVLRKKALDDFVYLNNSLLIGFQFVSFFLGGGGSYEMLLGYK